jgi:hypothetical protein
MSLPQRLYQLYREVVACELVKTRKATPENMLQFQNLLNKAFPENELETHQRSLVRSMYTSSPVGFYNYIYQNRSRVGALSLWTESRCLAKFLRLSRVVYISFNETTQQYSVVQFVPREKRVTQRIATSYSSPSADASQQSQTSYQSRGSFRRNHYVSRTSRNLRRFNGDRYSDVASVSMQETPVHSTSETVTQSAAAVQSTNEPVVESWANTQ